MASVVDLCNLALTHIGDPGVITGISPPDGSAQAARCAVLYPIARKNFLEAHDWHFAVKRATLADLDDATGAWLFRYAVPGDFMRISKILQSSAELHEPSEPFTIEIDGSGSRTVLTNVEDVSAVYVFDQTDVTKYSATAFSALATLLASYLAGPIVKGKAGVELGQFLYKRYLMELSVATAADASQHKIDRTDITPSGIASRA